MTADITYGQWTDERPGWDEYFLKIAADVSARADCTRRQVGYVITDRQHRIISTGYNGTSPGQLGCLRGACPRGRHFETWPTSHRIIGRDNRCGGCGKQWPCPDSAEPGSSYDTGANSCIALHAEANALLYAVRPVEGCYAYGTDWPCDGCMRLLHGARIGRIVTPAEEWQQSLSSGT